MTEKELAARFSLPAPDAEKRDTIGVLRTLALAMALELNKVEPGRSLSIALTELESACMWAEKAVLESPA